MDENLEILEYIVKNAEMGKYSCEKLIKQINDKENKIKKVVEGILKGYENFYKDSKKEIKKYKNELKENGTMAKMEASMMMKMDVMKDNSDAKIADMLIRGFTMGNIEIDKKIDKFKDDADKSILKLAKELKKFGEENIELLKPYL